MSTVTLVKGTTLEIQGLKFRAKEPKLVSAELARKLVGNPRFKVQFDEGEGRFPTELEFIEARTDTKVDVMETLREAVGRVDVDSEINFTEDGKPTIEALAALVGFEVTEAQRDAALAPPPEKKSGVRILRKTPREEPLDTATDATTLDAVTV